MCNIRIQHIEVGNYNMRYLLIVILCSLMGSAMGEPIEKEANCNIVSDGSVACYSFNGNANDESGNGNNGTVNGATLTTDRFGNSDSAYDFDGIDDSISVNNAETLNLTNEVTLSAWISVTNNSSWATIISKGQTCNGCVFVLMFG